MNSITQTREIVKPVAPYQFERTNLADILELCDHALQEYRDAWARFVATGDDGAFRQAMNAQQDRDALLAQWEGAP